jgi:hypothetical protein
MVTLFEALYLVSATTALNPLLTAPKADKEKDSKD